MNNLSRIRPIISAAERIGVRFWINEAGQLSYWWAMPEDFGRWGGYGATRYGIPPVVFVDIEDHREEIVKFLLAKHVVKTVLCGCMKCGHSWRFSYRVAKSRAQTRRRTPAPMPQVLRAPFGALARIRGGRLKRTRLKSMSDKKRAALLDPDVRAKKLKVQRERRQTARSLRQNKQGRKPLKKANPERQAKRRKSYAQKLAAYKRSETYKLVEARAGGQCEYARGGILCGEEHNFRCIALRSGGHKLTHHHKGYARFGGAELPSDIVVLCEHHNEQAESQHPTRNRNYRKPAANQVTVHTL